MSWGYFLEHLRRRAQIR